MNFLKIQPSVSSKTCPYASTVSTLVEPSSIPKETDQQTTKSTSTQNAVSNSSERSTNSPSVTPLLTKTPETNIGEVKHDIGTQESAQSEQHSFQNLEIDGNENLFAANLQNLQERTLLQQIPEEQRDFELSDTDTAFSLHQLPDAPPHWRHGDDMSFKPLNQLRIATLNVGEAASTGGWEFGLVDELASVMSNAGIDVLCLQELHIKSPTEGTHSLITRFAAKDLRLCFHAPPASSKGRSFTGVGIVTPLSWPQTAVFISPEDTAGRALAQIIHVQSNGRISKIGVSCHYGAAHSASNEALAAQVALLDSIQLWLDDNDVEICIIGADGNMIYDPATDCYPPHHRQACPNGFITHAIDTLGYTDALAARADNSEPIITHANQWRTTATPSPTTGSYLDRILVHGAAVLQAGCLAPYLCNLGRLDHALVVADILCTPLIDVPMQESTLSATPMHQFVSKFLAIASETRTDPKLLPEFLEKVRAAVPPSAYTAALRILNQVRNIPQEAPPTTRAAHVRLSHILERLVADFLANVYDPTIKSVCGDVSDLPPVASRQCFTAKQLSLIKALHEFNSQLPGSSADASPGSQPDFYHEILRLRWLALLESLPKQLWPSTDPWEAPTVVAAAETAQYRALLRGELQKVIRQIHAAARAHRDLKWRESIHHSFHEGNLHQFFQKCTRVAPPPTPTTASTFTNDRGVPVIASTSAERVQAYEQAWSKLYQDDPWPGLECIDTAFDPVTGYKTAHLSAAVPTPAQISANPALSDVYAAFARCRATANNWDSVTTPITPSEFTHLITARWGKAAGHSAFKICAMQFLPQLLQDSLLAILQLMWTHRIIPQSVKTAKLVLLPKPTGGERGISLLEEMLKALDSLLLERMLHSILPQASLADFLSPVNRAYKPATTVTDVIHPHAYIIEHALHHNKPIVCVMSDLAKFFDVVQIDIVEVVLRLKGAPQPVLDLIRAMYTDSTIFVSTPYGHTKRFLRNRGVHQGSALSCILCLLCLEPHHRTITALPSASAYCLEPGLYARAKAYCDDNTDYAADAPAAILRCQTASLVLAACGIGTDAKKTIIISLNIPDQVLSRHPVVFHSYDRDTGKQLTFPLPIQSTTATLALPYRLLGAHFLGPTLDTTKAKALTRSIGHTLSRIAWLKLQPSPLRCVISACVLSRVADSSILLSPLSVTDISRIDTKIAELARHSLQLPTSAPRALAFADISRLGAQMPSAIVAHLHAIQRELLISLSRNDYEGRLARLSYTCTCANPLSGRTGLMHRNITTLARFGIYVHSAAELLLARSLTILRATDPAAGALPSLVDREDQRASACTANAKYAVVGALATAVRAAIATAQQLIPNLTHDVTPPAAQGLMQAVLQWSNAQPSVRCTRYFSAIAEARLQAHQDWVSTLPSLGLPSPPQCSSEERSHLHCCPTADNRFWNTMSQCSGKVRALHTDLNQLDQPSISLLVATDGSSHGAACVVMRPPIVGDDYVAMYADPSPPITLYTQPLPVPATIGNCVTSSYDTESYGTVHSMYIRLFLPLGPLIADNTAALNRSVAKEPVPVRQRILEGRPHLHLPLQVLKGKLTDTCYDSVSPLHLNHLLQRLQQNHVLQQAYFTDLPPACKPAASPVHYFLPAPEHHCTIKIKSHQTPTLQEPPTPSWQAYHANARADTVASQASAASTTALIRIPAFRGHYFLLHGQDMVCTKLSHYLKARLRSDACTHWADLTHRRSAGLLPHCLSYVHPAAAAALAFPSKTIRIPLNTSSPDPKDTQMQLLTTLPAALLSQALRLDGSWTALLHSSPSPTSITAAISLAYNRLFPDLQLQPECCPFFLPAAVRGDFSHYRSLSCCQPDINTAVHAVLRATEDAMLSCAPASKWRKKSRLPAPYRSTLTPVSITPQRYPLLHALRWPFTIALDTSTTSTLTLTANLALTTLHLGMRSCSFPASITYLSHARPIPSDKAQKIETDKAIRLVQLRVLINRLLRSKLRQLLLPADNQEPDPEDFEDLAPPYNPPNQCCTEPSCKQLVATAHLQLCGLHTHQRRVAGLCDQLAHIMCHPSAAMGEFTPQQLLARYLIPRSASEFTTTWMLSLQNRLTGKLTNSTSSSLWVRKGKQAALDHTVAVLTLMHLPFTQDLNGSTSIYWTDRSTLASLCACPELVAPQYLARQLNPTAHRCSLCRGIRIICASQHTPSSLCLACNDPILTPATRCRICLRSSHSDPIPTTCSASSALFLPRVPVTAQWTCPYCQHAIAYAFSTARCNRTEILPQAIPRPPLPLRNNRMPSHKRITSVSILKNLTLQGEPRPKAARAPPAPLAASTSLPLSATEIPTITPEQQQLIEQALAQPADTTLKARTRAEIITPAVLRNLLHPDGWLTNLELDAASNLLHRALLVRSPSALAVFYRTGFYPDVRRYATPQDPFSYHHHHSLAISGYNIFLAHHLFIPINFTRSHWALIHITPLTRTVTYLDSLDISNRGPAVIRTIQAYLSAEAALLLPTLETAPYDPRLWNFVLPPTTAVPQQTNGSDCGVFVYLFMRNIVHDLPILQISPQHTATYRQTLAATILAGTFIYTVPDPNPPYEAPLFLDHQLPASPTSAQRFTEPMVVYTQSP